jgi:PKD repeat protein
MAIGKGPVNTLRTIESMLKRKKYIAGCLMLVSSLVMMLSVLCAATEPPPPVMDLEQTLSDGAQRCTIAFDGFALTTGTFEAQSFFPPGKVADYWGFQYLRDNTPNGNGHNTSFLTNCAFSVLHLLNTDQFTMLKTLAAGQVDQINLYAYKRFPLMKAFRRQLEGDLPAGSSGLSLEAVKAASSDLYKLDGRISFDRAVVYATIFRTLDASQKAYLETMKAGGFDSWTVTPEMEAAVRERMRGVSRDVSVALMTYAGDLFSWYAGSLEADVYFCPERQGTYFGSFYVKDAPAIGHEGYKIDEALTGNAGQYFLDQLATTHLESLVTGLVDQQRDSLYAGTDNIVQVRTDISELLRSLITAPALTDEFKAKVLAQVLEKSGTYGELDGEIVHSYAMAFAQVYQSMTDDQIAKLAAMRKAIMSGVYNNVHFDFSVCRTPFLYSEAITDNSVLAPYISNTDYLFDGDTITITISPSTATVQCGKTQQFAAPVSGTTDTGVIWKVNGVTGGNATVGTISTSGLYTAPSVALSPAAVTVSAIASAKTTKSASATVTVTVAPPVVGFTFFPGSPTAGNKVSFKNATTGSPTSWSWSFGDGSTSKSRNPTHTYSEAGSYTVTLTASNAGGSSTATKTLTVTLAPPVAAFTFSPGSPTAGNKVSFKNASTGSPASWSWSFGDGSTSKSQNPTHTYGKAGTYTVTLVVTNAEGSGSSTKTLTVTLAPPVAAFTFSPGSPTAGNKVSFKNASTGSPTSWSWTFGDGSTSPSRNPTHAYSTAGTYTVTLVAANAEGSSTTTKTVTVTVAQGSFSLTSNAGVDGGALPTDHTCDGTGSSPALSWSNAPADTKEFALMMTTLPVEGGIKWNWVLFGIPGTTSFLTKNSSGVGIPGVGSHGYTLGYQPPCSQGPGAKLYTFTLYALSASPTLPGAAEQVTGDVLTEAISSVTLGSASLNLSYARS